MEWLRSLRQMPTNMRNVHYRRRFFMWGRVVCAIAMWFGYIVLANWYYDVFLTSLAQAPLIACIVVTVMALYPVSLEDESVTTRFSNQCDNIARMLMGVAILVGLLYAGIIAVATVLH